EQMSFTGRHWRTSRRKVLQKTRLLVDPTASRTQYPLPITFLSGNFTMPLGSLLRRVVVFALLCVAAVPAISPAQEPAKPMEPAKETPLKEQTIYVPYAKLRAMFEKEGRGVFLPYDKFQE